MDSVDDTIIDNEINKDNNLRFGYIKADEDALWRTATS